MNPWRKQLLERLGVEHDRECEDGADCATRPAHISESYVPAALLGLIDHLPYAQRLAVEGRTPPIESDTRERAVLAAAEAMFLEGHERGDWSEAWEFIRLEYLVKARLALDSIETVKGLELAESGDRTDAAPKYPSEAPNAAGSHQDEPGGPYQYLCPHCRWGCLDANPRLDGPCPFCGTGMKRVMP